MALAKIRKHAMALSLCLAVAIGFAAPVYAHAVMIGDGSSTDPAQMSVPFTHEATLASAPDTADYDYWYVMPLEKGQTIEVTATAAPSLYAFAIIFAENYDDPYFNASDYVADGVERLTYMAPHTDDYLMCMIGSTVGTVGVNAVTIPAVNFKLGSMSMSSTAKVNKSFTIAAKLYPGYNSSTPPVKMYVQRKVSGKWRSYTSKTASKLTGSSSSSKFSTTLKMSKKGTYRVRAGFKDAAHLTTKYNSYKTVKVY